MRLLKQFFSPALIRPKEHETTSTLNLISRGVAFHTPYRGVPVFTPIGVRVLRGIEAILQAEAERQGFDTGSFPAVMKDEDLAQGAEVGEKFASKLVRLGEPFEDFHLLATPEMFMCRFGRAQMLSHRGLPIRMCYASDFFRNVPTTQTLVTCRQFRMFGMISIDRDSEALSDSLRQIKSAMDAAFARLGVRTRTKPAPQERLGFVSLYKHLAYEPDEPAAERELELAMGYHYASTRRLPLRYRNAGNRNAPASIFTYGASVYRLLHAVFESSRDKLGFNLQRSVRPFDVTVLPLRSTDLEEAMRLYARSIDAGLRPAMDERFGLPVEQKVDFSSYLGTPATVEVHDGSARVRPRGEAQERCFALTEMDALIRHVSMQAG